MRIADRITSRANQRYKALKVDVGIGGAKRTRTLLLGPKLIEAWLDAAATEAGKRFQPIAWLRLEGEEPHALEARLDLDVVILGESGSPPELALLVELGPEPAKPLGGRVIVPWAIQDPGNLGAILRSAAAFGFDEVLLGPGCTDPFSPKALRGTMGAAFLLPIRRCTTLVPDAGHWYALHGGEGSLPIGQAELGAPLRILVGHGWARETLPGTIRFLSIPMQGVESLNAAVAAGIACYEARRRG
jgi:RNA methyltransferase, TrmH family